MECAVELAKQTAVAMEQCPPPEGTKTKILERGGSTTKQQLVSNNPFPIEQCERANCGMCSHEASRGMCYKANVGYVYTCIRCEAIRKQQLDAGKPESDTVAYKYVGETSRTAFTRHLQHLSKYRTSSNNPDMRRKPDEEEEATGGTFMWSHTRDHHYGAIGPGNGSADYKLEIEGVFRDTMTRQIDEAVRMRSRGWGEEQRRSPSTETPRCVLMNGKEAFYKPKIVQTIFKQL